MTERAEHLTQERIHDYVDGELDADEARAVAAHAASCVRCARRLADVEALLAGIGALPDDAAPSRDLWPDIEARIGGGATVLPFPDPGDAARGTPPGAPSGGTAGGRPARAMRVTWPQLWAAGIAVALMSGSAVWFAVGAGRTPVAGVPGAGLEPTTTAVRVDAPDALPRSRVRNAATAYEEAVTDLEAALAAGRDLLDPETLRIVEESLATIDRAIAEAEDALARDPGSDLLNRLLLQHRMTRLRILRQATDGLGART